MSKKPSKKKQSDGKYKTLTISFSVPAEAIGDGIDYVTIHFADGHEKRIDVKNDVDQALRSEKGENR